MSSSRLQGIFTPNVVPLDARRQINEPELRRYVDWLIDRGVHGLYPNGSTGEFTRFTVEERRPDHRDHRRSDGRPRADPGRSRRGEHARDDSRLRTLSRFGRAGRGHRLALLLQAERRPACTRTSRRSPTTPRSTSRCTTSPCSLRRSMWTPSRDWPTSANGSSPSRTPRATCRT